MAALSSSPSPIPRVAAFIRSPECKSVVFLTGAGMSCAAGIPDFRSPGREYVRIFMQEMGTVRVARLIE